MLADLAPQLPYLVGMLADISHNDPGSTLGWCDDQTEFEFGPAKRAERTKPKPTRHDQA